MGVKIPWPGYLDPHPVIKKENKYHMIALCCIFSFYHCDKINSVGLNNFFPHIWLGIMGGGQDTPAGVS